MSRVTSHARQVLRAGTVPRRSGVGQARKRACLRSRGRLTPPFYCTDISRSRKIVVSWEQEEEKGEVEEKEGGQKGCVCVCVM